jgi:hypothetical protein
VKDAAGTPIEDDFDAADEPVPSGTDPRISGVLACALPAQITVPPLSGVVVEQPPLVSIRAPALPSLLEPTYSYLAAYCAACLPPRVSERLSVAIYELCANALQHGSPEGEVRVQLLSGGAGIRVVVENRAEPEQRERLRAQLERVSSDPAAAFAREMDGFERASQPPPMLGLVRVAHECGLELELSLDGERVRVSTSCAI